MSHYVPKRDKVTAEAIKLHKAHSPTTDYLLVEYSSNNYTHSHMYLNALIKECRRMTVKNHLIKVAPIKSDLVFYISSAKLVKEGRKRVLGFTDKTGSFELEMFNGDKMTLCKYYTGTGSNETIATVLVGKADTLKEFLLSQESYIKKSVKPRVGIYTVKENSYGQPVYDKLKKIQNSPVIHPSVENVTNDMDSYFDNVKDFTAYNMSGVRKVLLVGPPGTGKSSYAYKIASKHKGDKSVVFASNVNTVANHVARCCKSNVPTIIIWEDAESTGLNNAGAGILNFLDGIDQPQTTQGVYIMMTTNFPELIDARIKKRPGRVDKIFEFGALKGTHALQCAQIYFEDLFDFKAHHKSKKAVDHFTRLANLVNGMTGASIKGLAYSSKLYAAGNKEVVTLDLVEKVKKGLEEDLEKVDKYASEEAEQAVGFTSSLVGDIKDFNIDWDSFRTLKVTVR